PAPSKIRLLEPWRSGLLVGAERLVHVGAVNERAVVPELATPALELHRELDGLCLGRAETDRNGAIAVEVIRRLARELALAPAHLHHADLGAFLLSATPAYPHLGDVVAGGQGPRRRLAHVVALDAFAQPGLVAARAAARGCSIAHERGRAPRAHPLGLEGERSLLEQLAHLGFGERILAQVA